MSSIISRMQSEQTQTTPQQQPQQNPLVDNIAAARAMMNNPQQVLSTVINNPRIKELLAKGMTPETIARQMAAERGVDINQLLRALSGK